MGCLKLTYQTNLKPVYRVREREVAREEKESRQNLWETVDTGNYYYGARYYNPMISTWLSVDAMAHKGPNITPYAFSHNNPVMLVDPDGNWPFYTNPLRQISDGFAYYIGGSFAAVEKWTGSTINVASTTFTNIKTQITGGNVSVSTSTTNAKTTTVTPSDYFLSLGTSGKSTTTSTTTSVKVEAQGKAGPVPVTGGVSYDENGKVTVEGGTGVTKGPVSAKAVVYGSTDGDKSNVGFKATLSVPFSTTNVQQSTSGPSQSASSGTNGTSTMGPQQKPSTTTKTTVSTGWSFSMFFSYD